MPLFWDRLLACYNNLGVVSVPKSAWSLHRFAQITCDGQTGRQNCRSIYHSCIHAICGKKALRLRWQRYVFKTIVSYCVYREEEVKNKARNRYSDRWIDIDEPLFTSFFESVKKYHGKSSKLGIASSIETVNNIISRRWRTQTGCWSPIVPFPADCQSCLRRSLADRTATACRCDQAASNRLISLLATRSHWWTGRPRHRYSGESRLGSSVNSRGNTTA